VLILGAGFDTANRGVAALACGTLASVFHAFPQASVAFLDYSRTPVGHDFRFRQRVFRIPTVALRFSKNIFQPNHVVRLLVTAALLRLLPESWRARRLARNEWLHAIAEADLVGALSGGDSFSSLYGLRRLLYVSLPQFLVLAVGRPLTLLPQSYGPFATPLSRLVARSLLTRAHRAYSRDTEGVAAVRRLAPGARGHTAFAYDMGFALEPHPAPRALLDAVAQLRRQRSVFGLNVSGLLHAAGAGAVDRFGLRDDYAASMRELVIYLVEQGRCAVVLVPHVFGRGGESDVTATHALWNSLPAHVAPHVLFAPDDLDQHEVKDLIGHCDLFAGARMHACIAALSQCVPVVAFAYSDKFTGVLSSVGAAGSVVDLRLAARGQMRAAVEQALLHRVAQRAELEAAIPAVRESVLGFFGKLGRPAPAGEEPASAAILQRDFHSV
jgi:polysaccharide pyruvyl transferase WcaK-like protein